MPEHATTSATNTREYVMAAVAAAGDQIDRIEIEPTDDFLIVYGARGHDYEEYTIVVSAATLLVAQTDIRLNVTPEAGFVALQGIDLTAPLDSCVLPVHTDPWEPWLGASRDAFTPGFFTDDEDDEDELFETHAP